MGQQSPKSFPPPGEYRGIGADNTAVASVQPLTNATAMATTPLAPTPMIQSPNSTTTAMPGPISTSIATGVTARPVSPTQDPLNANLNIKSTLGNMGAN